MPLRAPSDPALVAQAQAQAQAGPAAASGFAPEPRALACCGSCEEPQAGLAAQPLASGALALLEALAAARTEGSEVPSTGLALHRVSAGAALLHEGAEARQICVVHAGTFKSVKTGEDGYEHVLAFAWRGDVLGFDGWASGRHASAAVALEDSVVLMLPLRQLEALRHANAAVDHALMAALSRQLGHAVELAELMSAVAADSRLARFLLHLSARMAERGLSPRRLRLRMNRREIASHLGLAHETVSRAFSLLAERGFVQVENREIEITDMHGLRNHAHCTRGPADEPLRQGGATRRRTADNGNAEQAAFA